MNKLKLIFISLLITVLSSQIYAQSGTIRGVLIDDKTGETVIGATVRLVDRPGGAITDLDGSFTIITDAGNVSLKVNFISYDEKIIDNITVKAGEVTVLGEIRLVEESKELGGVVITATQSRTSESALITMKRKSAVIFDGISASKIKLSGDGTAVEAAKRVTGVSVEDGKYVYIRGLGDRYTKTTLNGMDLPGLDPDKNSIQLDIFPTNMIGNITVAKNFTADQPADFTGGLLNIETSAFPDKPFAEVSLSLGFNPDMHLNNNFLDYKGSSTDILGFDNGKRDLPKNYKNAPSPFDGKSSKEDVDAFINGFDKQLGAERVLSVMDHGMGVSVGDQFLLKSSDVQNPKKLGYVFSLTHKGSYTYFDDVINADYQRESDATDKELKLANEIKGEIGKRNILVGVLGGVAYKTSKAKHQVTMIHLQNGERQSGLFNAFNDGARVGQSGYVALSNNLEYNQRSLSNLNYVNTFINQVKKSKIEFKVAGTRSASSDPDIRQTAFTYSTDTNFSPGAAGVPTRIWRNLKEYNFGINGDFTKDYKWMARKGKFMSGLSTVFKARDYEILRYNVSFSGTQNWTDYDPNNILDPENLYPNRGNGIYFVSDNPTPNSNEYQSNLLNLGAYISNELEITSKFKTILGLRSEFFTQRHTGRDVAYAGGNRVDGRNLENKKVLESLDLFPSANFIYALNDDQNLRLTYGRTIARPSFKELSFAQILDPLTSRTFNGGLFPVDIWDGNLTETRINNVDVRWEYFSPKGSMLSTSGFFKSFNDPIEVIRFPASQTVAEYQPRNVGDGLLYGIELEGRTSLDFISSALSKLEFSSNVTLVQSLIDMTTIEEDARRNYERKGETIQNTRAMAGQSPYVINAGLSYSEKEKGFSAGLFYNVKGSTLYLVGNGLIPDVYFEPFHSLNANFNIKLGKAKKMALDFGITNLLQSKINFVYKSFETESKPFSSYSPGMTFGAGVSYKIK